jgi:hypothetical protein
MTARTIGKWVAMSYGKRRVYLQTGYVSVLAAAFASAFAFSSADASVNVAGNLSGEIEQFAGGAFVAIGYGLDSALLCADDPLSAKDNEVLANVLGITKAELEPAPQ